MSARREIRCSNCWTKLTVPAEAQTIRCASCHSTTRVQPVDPVLSQVEDSVNQAVGFFKGLIVNASSAVANSLNAATAGGNRNRRGHNYLLPARPSPGLIPISAHGTRKAVLCGVSYPGKSHSLKGSVDDVRCMRYFLVHKLGFPSDSILVLSEEETTPTKTPTKANIRMAMQWLIQGCKLGDSLLFHYSGHGSRQLVIKHNTIEGGGEGLCPTDHETEGIIPAEEIHATIVRPLPEGAKLHAIIDMSNSGNILSLPYICRINRDGYYLWEDRNYQKSYNNGSVRGLAILLTASEEYQTPIDATMSMALSGTTATGALTYSFIQVLQNEPGLTYGRLMMALRYSIREPRTGMHLNGPVASFVKKVFYPKSSDPQLLSSEKFDIHSKPFIL